MTVGVLDESEQLQLINALGGLAVCPSLLPFLFLILFLSSSLSLTPTYTHSFSLSSRRFVRQ